VDVLVAPVHEVLDVLNDLQHGATFIESLGRHPRSIAVVNTIVPPLEDRARPLLELIVRLLAGLVLLPGRRGQVGRLRNAEEPNARIRPGDPTIEEIAEAPVTLSEELVEERLDDGSVWKRTCS
jgi:hypothetical protein